MKLYIGSDHAGFDLKERLKRLLVEKGHDVKDLGGTALDPTDDYPDAAHAVATHVAQDNDAKGVLLCGNAEGVCIVANKTDGVRAGIGYSQEAIQGARRDDDINVLCLPGRLMSFKDASANVEAFLQTPFSGAPRHKRRLKKIEDIEDNN